MARVHAAGGSIAQFIAYFRNEIARWKKVSREAEVRIE
jgi:hypothetical protein